MSNEIRIKHLEQLTSYTSGMLMMALFTSIWTAIAYSGLKHSPYQFALILFLFVILLLIGYAIKFLKMAKRYSEQSVKTVSEADKRRDKRFMIIFIAEGVGIFVGINIVINLGYPNLVVPVIALVVGLHFFPLARLFKRTQDYYLAVWSTIIAVCGMLFSIYGIFTNSWTIAFVGVGMAVTTSVYGCLMLIRGLKVQV